jgi:hypothetical protein
VKRGPVDLEKLRVALRQMSQGRLLMIAERAIEIVPSAKLGALAGDMVRLHPLVEGEHGATPLLDEVRTFHDGSLRGDYYDSFDVNSKNCMDKSKGTEAFIAEFNRRIGKCVRTAVNGSHASAREAFERLFALLRRLDEDPDSDRCAGIHVHRCAHAQHARDIDGRLIRPRTARPEVDPHAVRRRGGDGAAHRPPFLHLRNLSSQVPTSRIQMTYWRYLTEI